MHLLQLLLLKLEQKLIMVARCMSSLDAKVQCLTYLDDAGQGLGDWRPGPQEN